MAEDMIARAVGAIAKRVGGTDAEYARDVLLAALDPEDHLLVEAVARSMCADLGLHADDWDADGMGAKIYKWQREANTARAAIEAIKRMAQGEQPVRSDMREKD